MNYGGPLIGGGYGGVFSLVNEVVWLAAGILLVIWLWKQINPKG